MDTNSIFTSHSSEQLWVQQITEISEKVIKIHIDIPVSIFRVPATLTVFKPEAYMPQLMGLGPYHHFRPELYEMERYKFTATRRVREEFPGLEFKNLVPKLKCIEYQLRASYQKHLDIQGDTLAWVMAVDGLFLIDFLENYVKNEDDKSSSATMALSTNIAGRKFANDLILRDIMMLENQIPILLLKEISSSQCLVPEFLSSILLKFCEALSPLNLEGNLTWCDVLNCEHLLDVLYHLIVPKLEEQNEPCNINEKMGESSSWKMPSMDTSSSNEIFASLSERLSNYNNKVTRKIVVAVGIIADGARRIVSMASKQKEKAIEDERKAPMVEEIMIPSVSYLSDAGIEFCPTNGGISTIKFDERTKRFYLPVINLNVNSEVMLRNLVAYEASAVSDSLVFTRYTELMNGIIDTVEDAKVLRQKKIIKNSLKTDADVAELFNGMSKSIRLTNVSYIDKAIEDVNRFYFNTPKVRLYKRAMKYVYGSWKILTILAVVLMVFLTALQTFCSIYDCPHTFDTST